MTPPIEQRLVTVRGSRSRQQVADGSGVSARHLEKLEKGERPLTLTTAAALDRFYGLGGSLYNEVLLARTRPYEPFVPEHAGRHTHTFSFDDAYTGPVWPVIHPVDGNVGRVHRFDITWGHFHRIGDPVTVPAHGLPVRLHRVDGTDHPMSFHVEPAAVVVVHRRPLNPHGPDAAYVNADVGWVMWASPRKMIEAALAAIRGSRLDESLGG